MKASTFLLVFLLTAVAAWGRSPIADLGLAEVIETLDDPNPALRVEAADELGRRRDPRGLIPLIRLLRDIDITARAHAAEALRALGDERAVPFLSRALDDPEPIVRCRVVLALGDVGGKYVLPALKLRLKDPAPVVRAAVVRALGEIGDPLTLEDILSACRREKADRDDAMAAVAFIAAAKIGGEAGLDSMFRIVGERLPESWFLRASAARACGLAKATSRIPLLATWLEKDVDARVSQAAAMALAMVGAEEQLLAALALSEPFRRRAAVSGIDFLSGKKVRVALVRATRDDDPGVVLEAAAALLKRGEVQAIPLLIDMLELETPSWMGALQVLELRTGMPIGRNPPAWREWYKAREDHLTWDDEEGVFKGVR